MRRYAARTRGSTYAAIVVLAALMNSLKVVRKPIERIRITINGAGAAVFMTDLKSEIARAIESPPRLYQTHQALARA